MEENKKVLIKKVILIGLAIAFTVTLIVLAIFSDNNALNKESGEIDLADDETFVTRLTSETFEETIKNADKPVLVDYYANWCGPCRMMAPILNEMTEEIDDFDIYKIDTTLDPELFEATGENSIPLFIMYNEGKEVFRINGALPKEQFIEYIYKHLDLYGIEYNKESM